MGALIAPHVRTMTMRQLIAEMTGRCPWFDPDNIRTLKARLGHVAYFINGGHEAVFIASVHPPHRDRYYAIWHVDRVSCEVRTWEHSDIYHTMGMVKGALKRLLGQTVPPKT